MLDELFDSILDSRHSSHRYVDNNTNITRLEAIDAKARAREASTEITFLKPKVEKLMMITEALWLIVKETNNLTCVYILWC